MICIVGFAAQVYILRYDRSPEAFTLASITVMVSSSILVFTSFLGENEWAIWVWGVVLVWSVLATLCSAMEMLKV